MTVQVLAGLITLVFVRTSNCMFVHGRTFSFTLSSLRIRIPTWLRLNVPLYVAGREPRPARVCFDRVLLPHGAQSLGFSITRALRTASCPPRADAASSVTHDSVFVLSSLCSSGSFNCEAELAAGIRRCPIETKRSFTRARCAVDALYAQEVRVARRPTSNVHILFA